MGDMLLVIAFFAGYLDDCLSRRCYQVMDHTGLLFFPPPLLLLLPAPMGLGVVPLAAIARPSTVPMGLRLESLPRWLLPLSLPEWLFCCCCCCSCMADEVAAAVAGAEGGGEMAWRRCVGGVLTRGWKVAGPSMEEPSLSPLTVDKRELDRPRW